MPEYIEREALTIENLEKYMTVMEVNIKEYGQQVVVAVDDLMYLPAADVSEVVRCMHCKWFKTNTDKENYCDRHSAVWYKFYIRPDDFCSYGERKDD